MMKNESAEPGRQDSSPASGLPAAAPVQAAASRLSSGPLRIRTVLLSPWFAAAVAALVGFAALLAFEHTEERRAIQAERLETLKHLSAVRARLEGELNALLLLTRGFEAHIAARPEASEEELERIGEKLLAEKRHVRNLAIAHGYVVRQVIPLRGNEPILGLNYLERVDQREAVLRAVATRQSVLAGPVTAIQGDKALISRSPIFLPVEDPARPGEQERFWGLVSLRINVDSVFATAGLTHESLPIIVAIRGRDGLGPFGEIFHGSESLFDDNPVLLDVQLPGGRWQMAARLKPAFQAELRKPRDLVRGLSLLATSLLVLLAFGTARYLNEQARVHSRLMAVIAHQSETEAQMRHLATHDPLTGLANRSLFMDQLEYALRDCRRQGGLGAILFIDLNDFKDINDTLGHHMGDQLLCAFVARTHDLVRDIDRFARLGGDEFGVIAPHIETPEGAALIAQRLLDALATPLLVAGRSLSVSASIGITLFPTDGNDPQTLLQYADMAMYNAKRRLKKGYTFFQPTMNRQVSERLALEYALRQALSREEFYLVYQPKLCTLSEQVIGMEALVRWRHPERGEVAPGQFIETAERSGLIIPLGEWVLRQACRDLQRWRQELGETAGHGATLSLPPVAVNFSPIQFQRGDPVETIRAVLEETGLPPAFLEVEVTESALMEDVAAATETMQQLRRLGVSIAIDDFGTGYSSLAYLRHFPVQRMKIDRSFIWASSHDPGSVAIIETVLSLGRALNLKVTAEGVETPEQLAFLRIAGCDEIQGYHFARPMLFADLQAFVRRSAMGPENAA